MTVVMTGVTSRTRAARIVIVVGVATVVIVLRLLVGLSLAVLFAFHPTILEPDFDLTLRQIEVSCQLPTFLLLRKGLYIRFALLYPFLTSIFCCTALPNRWR